jgi:uncharacterized protein YdaU (DUF1376 family)
MSRAWMPLYIGDYLADTKHLTTEQHGAYLLLIMHYWQRGGLPDDEEALACIAGFPNCFEDRRQIQYRRWRSICLAIASLFQHPGWRHKRIDRELQRSAIIREKRQISGRIGGMRNGYKGPIARVISEAIAKQTVNQSHKKDKKEASEKKLSVSASLTETVRAKGWA